MTRTDGGKRAEWQKRLDEFEASGLTVAQFCLQADVTPHTFYYWKKRLGHSSEKRRNLAERELGRKSGEAVTATPRDSKSHGPLITFTWGSALLISVPAHCVDAIRCVLECARQSGHDPSHSRKPFQEVVLVK